MRSESELLLRERTSTPLASLISTFHATLSDGGMFALTALLRALLTLSILQTLNERAGFLSNFEVLQLLRTQRTTTEQQIKVLHKRQKEKKEKGLNDSLEVSEAERIRPQDLHTVTFEVSLPSSLTLDSGWS